MKIKQMIGLAMLVSCYSATAYAEMTSGTVTSIDASGQNVTLRRADTNAMMTVHVKDRTMLGDIASGDLVNLDVNKNGSAWEATSFKRSPDTGTGSAVLVAGENSGNSTKQ